MADKWPEELPNKIGAAYNPGVDGIADSFFYVVRVADMDEARRRWRLYPKLVGVLKEADDVLDLCEDQLQHAADTYVREFVTSKIRAIRNEINEVDE